MDQGSRLERLSVRRQVSAHLDERGCLVKIQVILLLIIAALSAHPLHAQDEKPQHPTLEAIADFLKQNVMHRTVIRSSTSKLAAGRIDSVFDRSMSAGGLLHSEDRVQF